MSVDALGIARHIHSPNALNEHGHAPLSWQPQHPQHRSNASAMSSIPNITYRRRLLGGSVHVPMIDPDVECPLSFNVSRGGMRYEFDLRKEATSLIVSRTNCDKDCSWWFVIQIDCCINPSRLSRLSGLSDQDESLVSQTALRTNNFEDATSGVSFSLLIAGALGACALTATLSVLRRRRRRKRNIKSKIDTLQTNPIESPKLSETSNTFRGSETSDGSVDAAVIEDAPSPSKLLHPIQPMPLPPPAFQPSDTPEDDDDLTIVFSPLSRDWKTQKASVRSNTVDGTDEDGTDDGADNTPESGGCEGCESEDEIVPTYCALAPGWKRSECNALEVERASATLLSEDDDEPVYLALKSTVTVKPPCRQRIARTDSECDRRDTAMLFDNRDTNDDVLLFMALPGSSSSNAIKLAAPNTNVGARGARGARSARGEGIVELSESSTDTSNKPCLESIREDPTDLNDEAAMTWRSRRLMDGAFGSRNQSQKSRRKVMMPPLAIPKNNGGMDSGRRSHRNDLTSQRANKSQPSTRITQRYWNGQSVQDNSYNPSHLKRAVSSSPIRIQSKPALTNRAASASKLASKKQSQPLQRQAVDPFTGRPIPTMTQTLKVPTIQTQMCQSVTLLSSRFAHPSSRKDLIAEELAENHIDYNGKHWPSPQTPGRVRI